MEDNDGRKPAAWIPQLVMSGVQNPVVQVIEEKSGEVLYTVPVQGDRFQPRVYAPGRYTVKISQDKPDGQILTGLPATTKNTAGQRNVKL